AAALPDGHRQSTDADSSARTARAVGAAATDPDRCEASRGRTLANDRALTWPKDCTSRAREAAEHFARQPHAHLARFRALARTLERIGEARTAGVGAAPGARAVALRIEGRDRVDAAAHRRSPHEPALAAARLGVGE